MAERRRRITQRDIARIAGVSQSTVSMVLNNRVADGVRIPEATRRRVREVFEQANYVADPAARRLAGADNKILGVFTYENAWAPERAGFYAPFLDGIERAAERLGVDLLFLTGAPVREGRRNLLDHSSRVRMTDGCLLLGQQMNETELEILLAEGFPCVAVGRRDSETIPYVGVDYASAVAQMITRIHRAGHRSLLYVTSGRQVPSARDRLHALEQRTAALGMDMTVIRADAASVPRAVGEHLAGHRCVVAEDDEIAVATTSSLDPDVSLVALGEVSGRRWGDRPLTGLRVPRPEIGEAALTLLQHLITADDEPGELPRTLLPCSLVDGATLQAVAASGSS